MKEKKEKSYHKMVHIEKSNHRIFFNIETTKTGDIYIKITESKYDSQAKRYNNKSINVWSEELKNFGNAAYQTVKDALEQRRERQQHIKEQIEIGKEQDAMVEFENAKAERKEKLKQARQNRENSPQIER